MANMLASYLADVGIKDAEFGALIGKDRTIISRLRRGQMLPTLEVAAAIERATNGCVSMQSWTDRPEARAA